MYGDMETPLPPAAVLRNEFSIVELRYARRGDAVTLVISDRITDNEIQLDSTELETLARAPHELFRKLLRDIDDHHDARA